MPDVNSRREEASGSDDSRLPNSPIPGDNPIRSSSQDTLGRDGAAHAFARHVLVIDASEGAVVAVLGEWGSGKTSFVNLARTEFVNQGVTVLDYNPWMFSGSEQLVESFFIELSAQVKLRPGFGDLSSQIEEYGEVFSGMGWLPVVGPWIERTRGVAKVLGKVLQRRKEGIGGRRQKLESTLRELDKPLVVVLDDIDRLSTAEIRDVFRLIRLTASFPNLIYVVAFDRARVEQALSEEGVPGRLYLEKIIQVVVDLPAIPDSVLNRQVLSAIDAALVGVDNPGPFDEQLWPDVFMEIVRPLLRNMRDARRYAAAVFGTSRVMDGQMALVDLLAMEAVRVMLPEVYLRLQGAVDALTSTYTPAYGPDLESARLKGKIDEIIAVAGTKDAVARAMIKRLFPAADRHLDGSNYTADWKQTWRRERRVAHEDILRLYLEHTAGEGLQAFNDAERAFALITDAAALEGYLRSLDPERIQDVVGALEAFEEKFGCGHIVPGATALLNVLPDLPSRQRSMLELDTRMTVIRVVYRLVRSCKEPDAREAAVRQTLSNVTTLSSKHALIMLVGYRENAGHKLVTEAVAAELERDWRVEVRGASADTLSKQWDLLRVLYAVANGAEETETVMALPDSSQLTLALLESAYSESMSQQMGSRAITHKPRLAWDVLVQVCGDEETLLSRLAVLKATAPAGFDELLDLADKYANGWRPKDFGDEE
ncbi:MAG: P-loop NTPase fold protein [Coriobacteriia bacterium]|nr:P-loop NTPase fold protein [Coriobacteriia bacterium]